MLKYNYSESSPHRPPDRISRRSEEHPPLSSIKCSKCDKKFQNFVRIKDEEDKLLCGYCHPKTQNRHYTQCCNEDCRLVYNNQFAGAYCILCTASKNLDLVLSNTFKLSKVDLLKALLRDEEGKISDYWEHNDDY